MHSTLCRSRQPSIAWDHRDFVLFHQELETFHVLVDDAGLARLHRSPVQRGRTNSRNPELGRVLQVFPYLGVEE